MEAQKSISTFRKTVTLFVRLLCIVLLLFVFFLVFQMVKHPEEPPSILGYQPFTVLSNSMQPSFETGDMVIVKSVNPSEIKVSDVITFQGENKYITHRVVDVIAENGSTRFVTKGDNNNVNDEKLVTSSSLVGKQIFLIANAGFIANFVSGPIGFVLIIILPLAGYIGLELYERIKKSYHSRRINTQK